jgi:proteasome lid subunit RPN8/RPN11
VDDTSEERWRTGAAVGLIAWRVPQCPFLIECCASVLQQIVEEVDTAGNLPGGARETGGVLFGIQESARVRITAYKPLQCEHAMGAGFVLSKSDETRLSQLISDASADHGMNSLQALGWYHSHIRSRIFLSERDLQIHSRYFAAPYQVALVIRRGSDGPVRAGFFFREASGVMRTESSYEEFAIETTVPPAPEPKPTVVARQTPSRRRTSAPEKSEPRFEAICPKCGGQQLRRSRRVGAIERFREVFGYYPYRCHECLSRFFLKTSSDLLERARSGRRKRPEERRRAWLRARQEILLWGCGVVAFLAILYYMVRETGLKP